jgi:hypothetical protein
MFWWITLALVGLALILGWVVDRRRHPSDVTGHARHEQDLRDGTHGGPGPH